MTEVLDVRHETCAETAKRVRSYLKANYPDVKFSVRSSSFANGTAIDVSWTDGPGNRTIRGRGEDDADVLGVYDQLQQFSYSWFDGMTDMSHYKDPVLYVDEDGRYTEIRSGAKFVQTHREISQPQRDKAAREIAKATGEACDFSRQGAGWNTHYAACVIDGKVYACEGSCEYGSTLMHQLTARAL